MLFIVYVVKEKRGEKEGACSKGGGGVLERKGSLERGLQERGGLIREGGLLERGGTLFEREGGYLRRIGA